MDRFVVSVPFVFASGYSPPVVIGVGSSVGRSEGWRDGSAVGRSVGNGDGWKEGEAEG